MMRLVIWLLALGALTALMGTVLREIHGQIGRALTR